MALKELGVRNFAIIKQLEIEIDDGLTVITGETGAGKSIILGALNLLLGARADANMIRHGEEQCEIYALFDVTHLTAVRDWLATRDLADDAPSENHHHCLIRRVIRINKPTKCYVNDRATTLGSLKELGSLLVDLHGQHEHQSLLRPTTQRDILDQFAGHADELRQMAQLASKFHRLERELAKTDKDNRDTADKLDLLAFQLAEFKEASLKPGEFEELEVQQARLANTEILQTGIQAAIDALHHNEQHNVRTELGKNALKLQQLAEVDSSLQPIVEQLNNALNLIEDTQGMMAQCLAHIEADPETLLEIDARIALWVDLARKHRCNGAELLNRQQQLQQEFTRLETRSAAPERLEQEIREAKLAYQKLAEKISAHRQKVAQRLSRQISEQMQDLGMRGGKLTIKVMPNSEPLQITEFGMDDIDFRVSTNRGMPEKPLNKTASGGELSRISLAIQVITSQRAQTPSLVFDEVDVGVGGKVAGIVGERLHQLSQRAQVLCITHLPQVAAQGDHHFAVDKITSNYATWSTLLKLDEDQRTEEIARMLGGKEITEQTRAHAAELLAGTDSLVKSAV